MLAGTTATGLAPGRPDEGVWAHVWMRKFLGGVFFCTTQLLLLDFIPWVSASSAAVLGVLCGSRFAVLSRSATQGSRKI